MKNLRNLPIQNPENLAKLIDIRSGKVVSMSLSNNEHCIMNLCCEGDDKI